MNKLLRIPPAMWSRIDKYLQDTGFSFTEFVKRAIDEFLKSNEY